MKQKLSCWQEKINNQLFLSVLPPGSFIYTTINQVKIGGLKRSDDCANGEVWQNLLPLIAIDHRRKWGFLVQ